MDSVSLCFTGSTGGLLAPTRRARRICSSTTLRMSSASPPRGAPSPPAVPVQDRLLRLERALAMAVTQERYTDAAQLRDALAAVRGADPVLSRRDALEAAVRAEDFVSAAALRDELATLTERLARASDGERRVDRLLVLRGRADPANALRVATVSSGGAVPLGLVPDTIGDSHNGTPRVFLQPTWSPTADYVAFTEVTFRIENVHGMRAVSIADSQSRVVVMNAFDGTIVKAVSVRKPPFFYSWSPCGKTLTMLSNDPTSSTPRVALSAIHVVAPAGGAAADLDVLHGPLASAHPLLYDFCPRDSTRVVAHLGNSNTVCIVPVTGNEVGNRNLTNKAGTFGTPQWHPLAGADGREVVLFVEIEPIEEKSDNMNRADVREGIAGMRSIFSPVLDKDDRRSKLSPLDSLLGSSGSMFENFLRQGARRLGFKDSNARKEPDTKESDSKDVDEPAPEELIELIESDSPAGNENEFGQRIADGLQRMLPERSQARGASKWKLRSEEDATEKIVNRLVMCDVKDPTLQRTICRFTGVMAFRMSPDGRRLVTMVTDPSSGQDELTLLTGDFSPDTVDTSSEFLGRRSQSGSDVILSTPNSRVLAFFWSPDSNKLLFLSSIRGSRVGAAQWATFDTQSNQVVRYEKFVLSGIYIHCLNFFDQFAASMTPWSPDSSAFCYPGRRLTDAEKQRDASAPSPAPSSPLLAALLLQRENAGESTGFSAWVQAVPDTSKGKRAPAEPRSVVDNVEFSSWSPC